MILDFRKASYLALALIALAATGCSERVAATPLDSSKALDALRFTLDAWKKGDSVEQLKAGSPSIVAQDLEWLGGASLVAYRIEGEGEKVDSNLKVPVKLTLKKGGKDASQTATYLVTTSPTITVFRAFP